MPSHPAVIGRYQVRARLGQGGMGVVYLALDPLIDRLVAIKLLRVNTAELRNRFLREAAIAGRLHHPNIVSIYDVGEYEEQPFIAMEYVAGETLAEVIRRRAPLALSRKVELLTDLCEGLSYAHRAGLIHRDVKPSNMVVNREGRLKILDFGIARLADSSMTAAGSMVGTPSYMSPEQIEGQPVDKRSDIFSVGLVCYELLVYRRAFDGEHQAEVLKKVMTSQPEPLDRILPDLDPGLVALVNRATEKEAGKRYQDLSQLKADLDLAVRRIRASLVEETVVGNGAAPGRPPTPSPAPAADPGRRGVNRAALAQRRAERISSHLEVGRAALAAGDFEAAQEAAEQAALLDPDDGNVLDLFESIRHAQEDRQVAALLESAGARIDEGALTDAGRLLEQAAQISRGHQKAEALHARLSRAIEDRDWARKRAEAAAAAVAQARQSLEAGAPDAALRSAREALAYAPNDAEATALEQQAREAIDARRLARAQEVVTAARADMAAGRHEAALERLRSTDPHELVREAIAECERAIADLAARRALVAEALARAREALARDEVDEAAQRLDEARSLVSDEPEVAALAHSLADRRRELDLRARRTRAAPVILQARQALAREDADAARHQLDAARALLPDDPEVAELATALDTLRRMLDERARRRARADEELHEARLSLEADRIDEAAARLERAAAELPDDARIVQALVYVRGRQAEERRRAEFARCLADARSALDAGDLDASATALDRARTLAPDAPEVSALTADLDAAQREAAARRQAAIDREADELVREARGRFEAGDHAGALARLAQFPHAHPTVEQVRADLVAQAEISARLREEEARREAERREREAWVAAQVEAARHGLEVDDLRRVREALDALRLQQVDAALVTPLAAQYAVREAAVQRRQDADRQVALAQERRERDDLAGALAHVASALALVPGHAEAVALKVDLDRELAFRVQRDAETQRARTVVEQARSDFERGRRSAALARLRGYQPPHELVRTALADLEAQEEARRREREDAAARRRETREREAERRWLAERVQEARGCLSANDGAGALAILNAVRDRDATLPDLPALTAQAQALVDAARTEQERRRAIATDLADAAGALDREDFATAFSRVEHALGLDPDHREAQDLRARIERAREAADADRREREDHEAAVAAVTEARRRLEAGERREAVDLLRRARPHPVVDRAVNEFVALVARLEQEDADRQAQRAWRAGRLAEAHAAITRGRTAFAWEILRDLRTRGLVGADIDETEEEARSVERAFSAQQRRQAVVDAAMVEVRTRLERDELDLAERRARIFTALEPERTEFADLLQEIEHRRVELAEEAARRAALEREQRRAEEEEAARRAAEAGDPDGRGLDLGEVPPAGEDQPLELRGAWTDGTAPGDAASDAPSPVTDDADADVSGWIASRVEGARRAIAEGRFLAAIDLLNMLAHDGHQTPAIAELLREARRRQAAEDATTPPLDTDGDARLAPESVPVSWPSRGTRRGTSDSHPSRTPGPASGSASVSAGATGLDASVTIPDDDRTSFVPEPLLDAPAEPAAPAPPPPSARPSPFQWLSPDARPVALAGIGLLLLIALLIRWLVK